MERVDETNTTMTWLRTYCMSMNDSISNASCASTFKWIFGRLLGPNHDTHGFAPRSRFPAILATSSKRFTDLKSP
jgi:hypothetical protein